MRFEGLDLNLLVALEALLLEQNVSKAAERVHVSQSTLSGSLARLREFFKDDLLTPSGRNLILTPRGEALITPVTEALAHIKSNIITKPTFEPGLSRRTFSMMASDYSTIVCLSAGLARVAVLAPRISVNLIGVDGSAADRLGRGSIDLLIVPEHYIDATHPSEIIFEDEYIVAAWQGNTELGDDLSEDKYFELGHVAIRFADRIPSFEEWSMQHNQRRRRVEVFAPSFSLAPHLIIGTNRITTMHRRLAEALMPVLPLRILPVPFDLPPVRQMLQWRQAAHADPALDWLRRQLLA